MLKTLLLLGVFMLEPAIVHAEETVVNVNLINAQGVGNSIGTVKLYDSKYGLMLIPSLTGLPPGIHGFHVHQAANCGPGMKDDKMVAGLAACDHYDPQKTGKHEGPYGQGHKGDLPALYVDTNGKATLPLLAPRLKVEELKGHSLMIHAGGDNYADTPEKLGGGGMRIACGVIK